MSGGGEGTAEQLGPSWQRRRRRQLGGPEHIVEEEPTGPPGGVGTESWSSGRDSAMGPLHWPQTVWAPCSESTRDLGRQGAPQHVGGPARPRAPHDTALRLPRGKVAEGRRVGWYSPPCPGLLRLRVLPAKQNKRRSCHVSAKTTAEVPATRGPQTGTFGQLARRRQKEVPGWGQGHRFRAACQRGGYEALRRVPGSSDREPEKQAPGVKWPPADRALESACPGAHLGSSTYWLCDPEQAASWPRPKLSEPLFLHL